MTSHFRLFPWFSASPSVKTFAHKAFEASCAISTSLAPVLGPAFPVVRVSDSCLALRGSVARFSLSVLRPASFLTCSLRPLGIFVWHIYYFFIVRAARYTSGECVMHESPTPGLGLWLRGSLCVVCAFVRCANGTRVDLRVHSRSLVSPCLFVRLSRRRRSLARRSVGAAVRRRAVCVRGHVCAVGNVARGVARVSAHAFAARAHGCVPAQGDGACASSVSCIKTFIKTCIYICACVCVHSYVCIYLCTLNICVCIFICVYRGRRAVVTDVPFARRDVPQIDMFASCHYVHSNANDAHCSESSMFARNRACVLCVCVRVCACARGGGIS